MDNADCFNHFDIHNIIFVCDVIIYLRFEDLENRVEFGVGFILDGAQVPPHIVHLRQLYHVVGEVEICRHHVCSFPKFVTKPRF